MMESSHDNNDGDNDDTDPTSTATADGSLLKRGLTDFQSPTPTPSHSPTPLKGSVSSSLPPSLLPHPAALASASAQATHKFIPIAGTPLLPPVLESWSKRKARIRYFGYVVFVMFLTIGCPGTTLWNDESHSTYFTRTPYASFCLKCLLRILGVVGSVLVSYLMVQGSNPGYLYKEMMDHKFDHPEEQGEDEEILLDHMVMNHQLSHSHMQNGDIFQLGSSPNETKDNLYTQDQASGIEQQKSESMLPQMKMNMNMNGDTNHSSFPPQHQHHPHLQNSHHEQYYNKYRRKFCNSCEFAPPLRSHHCRSCDTCVATFDHHCQFIATCIGERNHCRFWFFLSTQLFGFIYCLFIVHTSLYGFRMSLPIPNYNHHYHVSSSSQYDVYINIWILFTKIILYAFTFSAAVMWGFHSFLALANLTTFEFSKGSKIDYLSETEMCDLPFSKRCDRNLFQFCCIRDALGNAIARFCLCDNGNHNNNNNDDDDDDGCCCRFRGVSAGAEDNYGTDINLHSIPVSGKTYSDKDWRPIRWERSGEIVRDSEDWWENPWQNKYYSCC